MIRGALQTVRTKGRLNLILRAPRMAVGERAFEFEGVYR